MATMGQALADQGIAVPAELLELDDKSFMDVMYERHVAQGGQKSYKDVANSVINKAFPTPDIQAAVEAGQQELREGLSGWDKFRIGAGESLNRAYGRVSGALGFDEAQEAAQQRNEITEDVGGAAAGFGRMAPLLATAPLSLGGATLTGQLLGQTALGAGTGALFSGDTAQEGALGGAIGGAAGTLVGRGLGRVWNARRPEMFGGKPWRVRNIKGDDAMARSMRIAQEEPGLRYTAGTASRGKIRQITDQVRQWSLFTRGPYDDLAELNMNKHATMVTRALNAPDDVKIDADTLRLIDDAIDFDFGKVADAIGDRVPLPKPIRTQLGNYVSKATMDDLPAGLIKGRQAMSIRSQLGEALRNPRNSQEARNTIANLIDNVDDLMESVASPDMKPLYAIARERYKTLLAIDPAVSPSVLSPDGKVNATALHKSLTKFFPKQYTRLKPTLIPETELLFHTTRALSSELSKKGAEGIGSLPMLTAVLARNPGKGAVSMASLIPGISTAARASMVEANPLAGQFGGTVGRSVVR
jgi:hypothetical protein